MQRRCLRRVGALLLLMVCAATSAVAFGTDASRSPSAGGFSRRPLSAGRSPTAADSITTTTTTVTLRVHRRRKSAHGTPSLDAPYIRAYSSKPPPPKDFATRCFGAVDGWCRAYLQQRPVPVKVLPVHSKACPSNCSGVGVCHADTGLCDCPAGWGGADCSAPDKRPCTNRYRPDPSSPVSASHINVQGRDLNWNVSGFTPSRCAGVCDADTGACFCDGPKFGRVPAPEGSPPATSPVREGRPLGAPCQWLATNEAGRPTNWGGPRGVGWHQLYGPQGWCMVDKPAARCGCTLDGYEGAFCERLTEAFCPNQCSGRGECRRGFCACLPGWFGMDCARRAVAPVVVGMKAVAESASSSGRGSADLQLTLMRQRPWLAPVALDQWNRSQDSSRGQGRRALQHRAVREEEAQGKVRQEDQGEVLMTKAQSVLQEQQQQQRQLLRHVFVGGGGTLSTGTGEPGTQAVSAAAVADTAAGAAGVQAVQQLPAGLRRRPFVFVYDMPATFVSRQLQYRAHKAHCTWRTFGADNSSHVGGYIYRTESLLHEMMLRSEHRTLDPQEADFFFVPVYAACHMDTVFGAADGPWFASGTFSRVKAGAAMYQRALDWIRQQHPHWNATGGANHIWYFGHDEGACWAPQEVYRNSIILSHWGRTSARHTSETSAPHHSYSADLPPDPQLPGGLQALIGAHPCYTPGKDLVIPVLRPPTVYHASPFLGAPQPVRDVLLFMRADMGAGRPEGWSRGTRQALHKLTKAHGWRQRYNIWVGPAEEMEGDYSRLLARSTFCLVTVADGWTAQYEDALLHGCIPVSVVEEMEGPFGGALDWGGFSLQVRPSEMEGLPQLLNSFLPEQVEAMQQRLALAWQRMAWLSHPVLRRGLSQVMAYNKDKFGWIMAVHHDAQQAVVGLKPIQRGQKSAAWAGGSSTRAGRGGVGVGDMAPWWLRPLQPEDVQDDAMGTIMQWLYGQLPAVKEVLRKRKKAAAAAAAASGGAGGNGTIVATSAVGWADWFEQPELPIVPLSGAQSADQHSAAAAARRNSPIGSGGWRKRRRHKPGTEGSQAEDAAEEEEPPEEFAGFLLQDT